MTHTIRLPDGRALGYALHGPEDGLPVLFFHGTPASHPNWRFFGGDDLLHEIGLRVIALDRPGIGRSSLQPNRTIEDWPADAVSLLDALALPRAGVLAHSCGSAYALACAVHLPERIATVSLVGGAPPHYGPPFREGMVDSAYAFLELASRRPRAARLMLRAMGGMCRIAPGLFARQAAATLPPADAGLLDAVEHRRAFLAMMRETLRGGPAGAQVDAALAFGPWELPLERIRVPVSLWHGEADRNVPLEVARYFRERIPTAELVTFPGDGHLSIMVRRGPHILEALRDRLRTALREPADEAPGVHANTSTQEALLL